MRLKVCLFFCLTISGLFSQVMNTRGWRKLEIDSLDYGIALYEEKKYTKALPVINDIYNRYPTEDFLKYVYGICSLYRGDKHEDAYLSLTDVYSKNKKVFNIESDLAKANHYYYKFDEALEFIEKSKSNKDTKPSQKLELEFLKNQILNARFYNSVSSQSKIINLGTPINSPEDEFRPLISADESLLIYNYKGIKSIGGKLNDVLESDEYGEYKSDLFLTKKQNDSFSTPTPIDYINSMGHDLAIALSHDGQVLFTYQDSPDGNGDILISYLNDTVYSQPKKLMGEVNSYSWEGSCSLSPDGKTLYFSSKREGGYGGKDIYRAKLLADSTWGNIVNLGDSINTPYDEDAPFIHADSRTLFYSSNGLKSSGGYDIFRSFMENDSTFKKTENLGFPINSPADDIYFSLTANGNKAFYSAQKKGGEGMTDIYSIETSSDFKKPALILVKGKIIKNNTPVAAEIKVEISSNGNSNFKSINSNNGRYLLCLPTEADYSITFKLSDGAVKTITCSGIGVSEYNEKNIDINFDEKKDSIVITATTINTTAINTVTVNAKTVNSNSVTIKSVKIKPSLPDNKNDDDIENVFPKTPLQLKSKLYKDKYPDISNDGLEFKVQIAAVKLFNKALFNNLKSFGSIESYFYNDLHRVTIGGGFKTLKEAYIQNRKVVLAGNKDAFIIVFYKGKRVTFEEMVQLGVLKDN